MYKKGINIKKPNYNNQSTQVGLAGPTNFTVQQPFHKNGSYGTIHTFKNYFATVCSVFSFQLSAVSKWTIHSFPVLCTG